MKEKDLHLESVLDFLIFIPNKSLNKVFTSNHNLFSEFKNLVLQMYLVFCAQKLFVTNLPVSVIQEFSASYKTCALCYATIFCSALACV